MTDEPTTQQLFELASGHTTLQQFLGLKEEEIQAIASLGFDLYQQGRHAEARTIFEGLSAVSPSSYYGPAGLGAIALMDESLEEAEAHLRSAATLNPNDPSVLTNLGECLLRAAKIEECAGAFDRALALDPEARDPGTARARAILTGLQTLMEQMDKLQQVATEDSDN